MRAEIKGGGGDKQLIDLEWPYGYWLRMHYYYSP